MPPVGKKNKVAPPEPAQQGAGLKMAAHPLLLDNTPTAPQSKKDRYKPMQPKFASIKVKKKPSCHLFLLSFSTDTYNSRPMCGTHPHPLQPPSLSLPPNPKRTRMHPPRPQPLKAGLKVRPRKEWAGRCDSTPRGNMSKLRTRCGRRRSSSNSNSELRRVRERRGWTLSLRRLRRTFG